MDDEDLQEMRAMRGENKIGDTVLCLQMTAEN